MCGILGIVGKPGSSAGLDRHEVVAMRDKMTNRGPDDAGYWEHRNVALGHRRLAIRDISGGAQPWISQDGQCALVYNGEIYNDDALRHQLSSYGHEFRSRCDTEVVMAAYRQWGTACPARLRGMFAFGIYDFRDDSLFLARDRFGVKPLFLTEIDGRLVFASSLPALLAHPKAVKAPCLPTISHYLTTFRLTLDRATMYEGMWQLLPGECLRWNANETNIERYWDYPTTDEDALHYDAAVENLLHGLQDSVSARLVSDVPVGMFLSGGVDSNTIACLIREVQSTRMIGQCGGGEGERSQDFVSARHCAEHVGFDFDEVCVAPDEYFNIWQWMIGEYGTPLSTPTDVILYRLANEMKKSVGVVLGGEGADELLCGYAVQHWAGEDFENARRLENGEFRGAAAASRLLRGSLRAQYGRDRFASETDHFFALNSLIPSAAKPALLQPWAWQAAEQDRRMWSRYADLFDVNSGQSTARKLAEILHRVNLEGLLSRLDSATMLASLEARVPYTDHHLVENMFRVPRRFKICVSQEEQAPYLAAGELEQRGTLRSKRILRTVAARLMPASLAHRKKASFPTPIANWLTGPWKNRIREQLTTSDFGRALFRPQALHELADNLPQAGMWLWPLVNVLCWGDRQFGDG
jgi:asparagine synthase (glutamine-hydrolysing)